MPCIKSIFPFYIVLLQALYGFSCQAHADWYTETLGIMGTEVNVTLWHENSAKAASAITSVMDEMRRINSALSPYIESSELSRLNRSAATSPVKVSDELARLIDKSLYMSKLSSGAFDITFASVARHYDYRDKKKPNAALHAKMLPALNYRLLNFNRRQQTVFFQHQDVKIDLGGIAKGYAVDNAVAILTKLGIKYASVSAGGDSRLLGDRKGRPWIVGIKNPRSKQGREEVAIKLPLSNVAMSTSGDYERFFIDDKGERIHHIMNPATGKSANQVMSVSVLGPNGLDTDPLSTTVFVLGVDVGLALINKLDDFDAVVIDIDGKVHYSEGLASGE